MRKCQAESPAKSTGAQLRGCLQVSPPPRISPSGRESRCESAPFWYAVISRFGEPNTHIVGIAITPFGSKFISSQMEGANRTKEIAPKPHVRLSGIIEIV